MPKLPENVNDKLNSDIFESLDIKEPVPKPEEETWYFTFGGNHITAKGRDCQSLGQSFVAITGTWEETREAMFKLRGNKWSFQYSWDDFHMQPVMFNLTEIAEEMIYLPIEERN